MGYGLISVCRSCDTSTDLIYGPGMISRDIHVPAIELSSKKVISVNYNEENLASKKYKFYTSRRLKSFFRGGSTLDIYDLKLNSRNNFCPNCRKFTFDFELDCLFD